MKRRRQRGSAMLVTMIVTSALIAGAGVLVSMQLASNRSADVTRHGLTATYCAEAGLDQARPIVASNYPSWAGSLCGTGCTLSCTPALANEPAWLNAALGNHDIDGDGLADFTISLRDNDDELPPLTNNPCVDNDISVFILSTCINPKYPDTQKQIEELVVLSGGGACYHSQAGNCENNGNAN
jgi:hypothetical protein